MTTMTGHHHTPHAAPPMTSSIQIQKNNQTTVSRINQRQEEPSTSIPLVQTSSRKVSV